MDISYHRIDKNSKISLTSIALKVGVVPQKLGDYSQVVGDGEWRGSVKREDNNGNGAN